MVNKKPTVVSTFAGGGGSSLGYHWAGFDELLAIDFDKNSCETLSANFDFPIWQRDIKEVTPEEILNFCKIKKGELDILDGSPPCQGFSTAGKRNLNDSRNDLFLDFVRLVNGLQPKVFVMENVSGMIKGRYKGKFNEILKTLKDTEYNVKVKLMNAMWYEVPQSRERLFFIGVRKDLNIKPTFPEPSKTFITVEQSIKDLINSEPDRPIKDWLVKAYRELKPNNIEKIFIKYKGTSGSSFSIKLLRKNYPSNTLTKTIISVTGLLHYCKPRYITILEAKRLCSFPDNYILLGDYSEQWARLGNSVMPKTMYHIAKHIKDKILTNCN